MAGALNFDPDWVSPPGATVAEILDERRIPLGEFARLMEVSLDWVVDLTQGVASIDDATAAHLERLLGPSANFWLKREAQYRTDVERLLPNFQTESFQGWLGQLPVSDMIRFGWIAATKQSVHRLHACLDFFAVSDIATWHAKYRSPLSVAAFRTSPTFESSPAAVSAWLRWAELKSGEIHCEAWDAAKFRAKLIEARSFTRKNEPKKFLPDLRRICAECGVALVIARAPKGCRASGATRFISSSKAMIVLSFRYRSDDQFWFTFFHEAGHLLLHGKDALFLEDGSEVTSKEENEANAFAAEMLIPSEAKSAFLSLRPRIRDIIKFAQSIGISPGSVVGQMQHAGRIRPDRLNGLKRHYSWAALEEEGFNL